MIKKVSSKLDYTVSLVLGDWSDDGHGKTDTVHIKTNFHEKAINTAYTKGTKKLGFNFILEVCESFEDNMLSQDKLKRLMKYGLKLEDLDLEDAAEDDDEIYMDINSYAKIYLFIVQLGNPNFKFRFLEAKEYPTLNIGGYGLFF